MANVNCSDCTSSCHDTPSPVDIEDLLGEIRKLQKQNIDLVQEVSKLRYPVAASSTGQRRRLRSEDWFSNDQKPELSALYLDRYLNYGLTLEELSSKRPIIGIAQSGSDLSPCNRYHLQTAKRVRDGIIAAGGLPIEFPTHPIQESSRRPTATLDRNLSYLTLVEILHSYPLDGVVLLTGCDKTTPAALMAAATVVCKPHPNGYRSMTVTCEWQNIPAICLNVGPMLNGRIKNDYIGTGTILWRARELKAEGVIDDQQFLEMVTAGCVHTCPPTM